MQESKYLEIQENRYLTLDNKVLDSGICSKTHKTGMTLFVGTADNVNIASTKWDFVQNDNSQ